MIKKIQLSDFRHAFYNMGRGNQFSYEALELLYNFYEEMDPNYELDVISICCDWCEYINEDKLFKEYGIDSIDELDHTYLQTNSGSYLVLA